MKTLYSVLIATLASVVLVTGAVAGDDNFPAWDKKIPGAARFKVLGQFGGAAVLDRETGLVWERSPDGTNEWIGAQALCNQKTVGNRKGWRLPTVQELASLMDPSIPSPGPMLPSGHPFSNIQVFYWSATTQAFDTRFAWGVDFSSGSVEGGLKSGGGQVPFWCVRGGQGVDPQ